MVANNFRYRLTSAFALLACAVVVSTGTLHAQENPALPSPLANEAPTLRFEQIAQEQGLEQVSANTIMQDRQGFIWIGTQGGLHRYDGIDFKVYKAIPFDTTSLSGSWVWGVSEASNGDIWVATENGGLNRLDRASGTFTHYRHDPDDSTSISSDRVFFPYEDSRGNLWAGTLGGGLNKIPYDRPGKFVRFDHVHDDSATLSGRFVFWMTEGPEGDLWVSTSNGLSRIDIETDEIARILFNPDMRAGYGWSVNILHGYFPPNDPGIGWFASGKGLIRLDLDTYEHELFQVVEDETLNSENFFHQVMPDPGSSDVLWLAGPSTGLARFEISSGRFTSYRNDPADPNSLSDNQATSLLTDNSGSIWVGTANAGINRFNPGAVNFVHLRNDPEDDQSLAPGIVWGLSEDSEGSIWVSTDTGAAGDYLTRFDGQSGKVIRYRPDREDPTSIPGGSLYAFAEDTRERFYIGGRGGFVRFNRQTGKTEKFMWTSASGEAERLRGMTVVNDPDDPDLLWLGFAGIRILDTRTDTFRHISLATDSVEAEPTVFKLEAGVNGSVFAATSSGVFEIDGDSVRLVSSYDVTDSTTIGTNGLQGIVERPQEPGVVWLVGDTSGLNRLDTKTGIVTRYTEDDGLSGDSQYGILADDAGTLWMGGSHGISNFDPETETFRNYGLDDGLMSLEYNYGGFFKGSGGVLYLGSVDGVTAFSPEKLRISETAPQIALTDFKIHNKSIDVGASSVLTRPLAETESITLVHDQDEVTFNFVALHYANPEKNTYAYMLEGHDPDWIYSGQQRSATYTNLPHGDYTFRVKAANADDVWNEEGISIGLTITPPWWFTWWAYGLYAIVLGLGIFAVDRFQRRRLRIKEMERSQLREVELRAQSENQRREDAERLSEMGRAITSTLSTREIIDTVYEQVNAMTDAAVFGIGIYDEEHNRIDFPATKEKGQTLPWFSNSLDDPSRPAVWCFKNRKEFVVGDYETEYEKYLPATKTPIAGDAASSIIYLPLIHQDKAVGVITTQSFQKDAYSDYDVSVLRTLAAYAAIAIDNAAAYRKLGKTLKDLQT
ncbi:MAG: GAF domain-containing protein, partial [Rhodothermales bacterium]|nr:GAF domain-containing protein [Rhodothermales bacterium]